MSGIFDLPLMAKKSKPSLIPRCGECSLWKGCSSPKMPVSGKGKKGILIVGDYPGGDEDRQGRPLVGPSGQYLEKCLRLFDIDMRRDCWLTNALICRPKGEVTEDKVDACRPNLLKVLEELRPVSILLTGGAAVSSLIGWLWKEDVGELSRWVGWKIPSQEINAWVCPTWNAALLLRRQAERNFPVMEKMFLSHLRCAVEDISRPWKEVPDYEKQVRVVMDDERAASMVEEVADPAKRVAWDLETDRLRPDHHESEILCCSLSDGETTFSFPWYGKVIPAMRDFLKNENAKKIGYSAKFEDTWCLEKFGFPVQGWEWDGMLAAHILDNRPDICSLEFQAFIRLGMTSHKQEIKPYMKAKSPNHPNRLRWFDRKRMLLYCGIDSLVEWKVAEHQRKEIGLP